MKRQYYQQIYTFGTNLDRICTKSPFRIIHGKMWEVSFH